MVSAPELNNRTVLWWISENASFFEARLLEFRLIHLKDILLYAQQELQDFQNLTKKKGAVSESLELGAKQWMMYETEFLIRHS